MIIVFRLLKYIINLLFIYPFKSHANFKIFLTFRLKYCIIITTEIFRFQQLLVRILFKKQVDNRKSCNMNVTLNGGNKFYGNIYDF